jgi:hypothetical protein
VHPYKRKKILASFIAQDTTHGWNRFKLCGTHAMCFMAIVSGCCFDPKGRCLGIYHHCLGLGLGTMQHISVIVCSLIKLH